MEKDNIVATMHDAYEQVAFAGGIAEKAVSCGHWPLYRFNPDLGENRYKTLKRVNPDGAEALMAASQRECLKSWKLIKKLAVSLEPKSVDEG